jgi:hypothetical protein
VSQQHGFGYNGTEPTGSTKLDDDHDGMQQKGENVEHAQDGIRPKKLKIQGACGIRHPHVSIDATNIYAESELAMKAKALAMCEAPSRRKWKTLAG